MTELFNTYTGISTDITMHHMKKEMVMNTNHNLLSKQIMPLSYGTSQYTLIEKHYLFKSMATFVRVNYIFGPASARSYKIGVVDNNWFVVNTIFSETALRIFLVFCIKGYLHYKMITSQNVLFVSYKSCVLFSRYSSFCIFNHLMIYQICDVMSIIL